MGVENLPPGMSAGDTLRMACRVGVVARSSVYSVIYRYHPLISVIYRFCCQLRLGDNKKSEKFAASNLLFFYSAVN